MEPAKITELVETTRAGDIDGYTARGEKEFEEIGKRFGLKYLGNGASRVSYAIDRWNIIKIEYGRGFAGQTRHEIEFLTGKLAPKYRKYYLLPKAWDTTNFKWVIFPRARPFKYRTPTSKSEEVIIDRAYAELERAGGHVGDCHGANSNWGLYLGKPVILDCGFI